MARKPMFSPEELAELAAIDKEIDDSFVQTQDEIDESRRRDRTVILDRKPNDLRKIAENKRAYYEANREKIAENKRAYYEANREKIAENKRAYREANREKINAYMRLHMAKKRAVAKAAVT